jgi:hypothetical protein
MSMNLWECAHPDCKSTAVGAGGAIGLRAIGWYFRPGSSLADNFLFCPAHRPDPIPCCDKYTPDDEKLESCPHCAGEGEAAYWQTKMGVEYEADLSTSTVPERRAPL